MSIFTVTTITEDTKDCRTWGWFPKIKDAQLAIVNNAGGMRDCFYKYAVIEEFSWGILTVGSKKQWFVWSEREQWEFCAEPEWAAQIINFGMG